MNYNYKLILFFCVNLFSFNLIGQIDILENNNIGIGLLNPKTDIHLKGEVIRIENSDSKVNSFLPFTNGSFYFSSDIRNGNKGEFLFRTYNGKYANRFIIRNTGLGEFKNTMDIGTPGETIEIGNVGLNNWAGLKNTVLSDNKSYALIQHTTGITILNAADTKFISFRLNNATKMVLNSAGNFGIGTNAPTARLSVSGEASKTGGGEWLVFSDKKLKKDIKKFEDGLETVLQINPVTFKYNGKAGTEDSDKEYVGVIAQEIEKIASYTVNNVKYEQKEEIEDDEGNLKSEIKESGNYLQFDGNSIKYMLVNAIKEQQVLIDDLRTELNELKDGFSVNQDNTVKEITLEYSKEDIAVLFQNKPNPTSGMTTFGYYLPNSAQQARILFYSVDGSLIHQENLEAKGYNEIRLNTDLLSNGMFYYSLEVDNQKIDQKSFVVSK